MLRTIRSKIGMLNVARTPWRVQSAAENGIPMKIQHVRFRRGLSGLQRFAINTTGSVVMVYMSLVLLSSTLQVLSDASEKLEKGLSTKEKQELDEIAAEPLFIPFPLTTVEHKPVPYRGTDPEWQTFLKLNEDAGFRARLQSELVELVKQICENNIGIARKVGQKGTVRRCWLDVIYPTFAPPEFTRSGIEIGDEGVKWTQHPVDSLTASTMKKVLYPVGPLIAVWEFQKSLFIGAWNGFAPTVGLKPFEPSDFDILMARHAAMMKQMSEKGGRDLQQGKIIPKDPLSATSTRDLPGGSARPIQGKLSDLPPAEATDDSKKSMSLSEHFAHPIKTFQMRLMSTRTPTRTNPPRGSLLVSGLIEVEFAKAWIVLDIKAPWDPKTKKYDAKSMVVSVRKFQMKKQAPGR